MSTRIASIDFGTNTARLLIADYSQSGSFEQIYIEREIIRMGGGFNRNTGLSSHAIQRGLSCLKRFSSVIKDYGVTTIRAVATSAVRDAINGRHFVESVLLQTGIILEVIDGTREAHLTLAGVQTGLVSQLDKFLLFDIGGGSTEYTLVNGTDVCFSSSLPLGVVRLSEGKVTHSAMNKKIEKELNAVLNNMKNAGVRLSPEISLVGTAGTATTLAAIQMEMVDYDYRRVNNAVVSKKDILSIYERLVHLAPVDRLLIPGLEKGREDLIIAGILITLKTMDLFGFNKMIVSDYGMLEGLIVSNG